MKNQGYNRLALVQHLDLKTCETIQSIKKSPYGYGDCLFEYDGIEYYSGTEEEISEACKEYIEQILWAFNINFLENYGALNDICHYDCEVILTPLQKQCENGNDAIKALVNWDDNQDFIVEDAISGDTFSHFLNGYDGHSYEITVNKTTYFICRT